MQVRSRKKRFFAWILNIILYIVTFPFRLIGYPGQSISKVPLSILIARLDHIGDVILSTPIYHSLKDKFPDTSITVLCGSWSAEILRENPYVDSIMVIDCPWWSSIRSDGDKPIDFIKKIYETIRAVKCRKFDVFIDLRGDIRHIFFFGWLTGIPRRISYTRSGGHFLLSDPHLYEEGIHEIDRNYRLLSAFGPLNKFFKPEIYPDTKAISNLKEKLIQKIDVGKDKYIVVFNGGRSNLRRLRNQKVAAVCDALIGEYAVKCCYVGGKTDYESGEEVKMLIRSDASSFFNLCGHLDLTEVKYLIDSAMLFIGTDSSVSQLSASSDTSSISLFGPVHPNQAAPIGDNKKVIYHPYPCSPCLQDICIITKSTERSECMESISSEEIKEAAMAIIENNSKS